MRNLFFSLIVLGIFFSACKKGDTGPAGKDGNANVKSYTLIVKPADWKSLLGSGYGAYPALTAVTDSVLNYGAVLLYYKSGTAWYALPALNYKFAYNRTTDSPGYVAIIYDGASAPTSDVTFRAVVIKGIPGATQTALKKMTFEQVQAFYGLDDELTQ